MTMVPFAQVDAFTDRPFAGNPAAVLALDAWPEDALLQQIAAENNLSETAFLVPDASGAADRELRWFTPETEVMLCGHATLASGHFLLSADRALERVRFRTCHAGVLEVARDGDGYAMALPTWVPEPKPLPKIVAALACDVQETLWHDHGYAVAVVASADLVEQLQPEPAGLCVAGEAIVIVTAPGRETDVVSRVFAPGCGIAEDPVTGSAHAVMARYWTERLGRDRFTAHQASARGGRLTVRLDGDRAILGGRCVTVIEGRFRLP
ncbi:PhzF family phenazine biosynthesis protein [Sphingomonas sp. ac-8]|uniref:PhzF family phenazine biosynthesis protein n=1 Tax=Sphingomonas sp. ac-8 TaxID=3242977 RepID=UPI003A805356